MHSEDAEEETKENTDDGKETVMSEPGALTVLVKPTVTVIVEPGAGVEELTERVAEPPPAATAFWGSIRIENIITRSKEANQ